MDCCRYIVILLLAMGCLGSAQANICAGNSAADLTKDAVAPLASDIQRVSRCDIEAAFEARRFPRAYWLLNEGLRQSDSRSDALEAGISAAHNALAAGDQHVVSTIYDILLAYFPDEPRVLSDSAVLEIYRENYDRASALLKQAITIDSKDPIIVGDAYALAMLKDDLASARKWNAKRHALVPDDYFSNVDYALFGLIDGGPSGMQDWKRFISGENNENNRRYWQYVAGTVRGKNPLDITDAANSLIDAKLPNAALLLLDYAISVKPVPESYFIRARAFEFDKHYKLAYASVLQAKSLADKEPNTDKGLYDNILHEASRLAYAAGEYKDSLALLDEFVRKGLSNPYTDYLYGANYVAMGERNKAEPYLAKCVDEKIDKNMRDFCAVQLKIKPVSGKINNSSAKKNASIVVPADKYTPIAYLEGDVPERTITWIGGIVKTDFEIKGRGVHVTWLAKYLKPASAVTITDGKPNNVTLASVGQEQYFEVELWLYPKTDESFAKAKEQFAESKEKYIVVHGSAVDVASYGKSLAAVVVMKNAIFTSLINVQSQQR